MTTTSGQFDTKEFAALPSDALPPLGMFLLDVIHDLWQPQTKIMVWSIKSMARAIGIPALQLSRVLNGFSPCFSLETAGKVADYFGPFGMEYETLLLAQLGYYAKHPASQTQLHVQEAGAYLMAMAAWLATPAWQASGGYFREQVTAWLEAGHRTHPSMTALLHPIAAYVRCWLLLHQDGAVSAEQWGTWATTLAPPAV